MKKLFAILMVFLTALSVGGVILYSVHKTMVTGGQAPEIHFDKEEIEMSTSGGDKELLEGVTATDQEDGDVTASVLVEQVSQFVEENTVEVTYVAYDSQNHVSRASRKVHYTDYRAPRFTMSGPMIFMTKNVSDLMNYVGAEDVVDGNISIKAHASFDDTTSALSTVGVHEVELSVTNSRGDTVRLAVPVKVVEDNPRSESIPLKDYLVYVARGASFDPANWLASQQQAEGTTSMGESEIETRSTVDTSKPGVYTVDYSIVRNEVTSASTRLIVVVQ